MNNKPDMFVFLDVDGVANTHTQDHMLPENVAHLDNLFDFIGRPASVFAAPTVIRAHNPVIVFNTAWNGRTIERMREVLAAAGSRHAHTIDIFQTDCCSGGGDPCRRWLEDNDKIGSPYIIIDDSQNKYGAMRCRLVKCDYTVGFDAEGLKQARKIVLENRLLVNNLTNHAKWLRKRAFDSINEEILRLCHETPWLDDERRMNCIREMNQEYAECRDAPDFLKLAYLAKGE